MVPTFVKVIFAFILGWLLTLSVIMLSYVIPGWDSLYPTLAEISTSDWVFFVFLGVLGGSFGVFIWAILQ